MKTRSQYAGAEYFSWGWPTKQMSMTCVNLQPRSHGSFQKLGAFIDYHDPYIPVIGPTREHAEWQGRKSVEWNEESIASYDVVVISTWHKSFSATQLSVLGKTDCRYEKRDEQYQYETWPMHQGLESIRDNANLWMATTRLLIVTRRVSKVSF